jgi:hypothetical protein
MDAMRSVTTRVAKLENRLGIAGGKPGILAIICRVGCNLNHEWCIGFLRECGFLPTSDGGVHAVILGKVPFGLSEEELKRYLRENGAEICGLRTPVATVARQPARVDR